MSPETTSFLTAVAALALVLLLIWLAQRLVRRGVLRLPVARGQRIAVLEAVALDTRRRLHLIRCDDRQFLLLTGGAQDLVVGWLLPQGPQA